MLIYLDIVRAFAILLITNSHLGNVYPDSRFAVGGMVGNCLFFLVSGFAISRSLNIKQSAFKGWLKKRLLRIYAPLLIATSFLLLIGYYAPKTSYELLTYLILPTEYWFLPAIAIFYVPIFFFNKIFSLRIHIAIISFILFAYFFQYYIYIDLTKWSIEQTVGSKLIFYFLTMYVGMCLTKIHLGQKFWQTFSLLVLFAIIYFISNKIIKSNSYFEHQFIVQMSGFLTAVMFFHLLSVREFKQDESSITLQLINYLSTRSLQIYIAQVPLLQLSFVKDASSFPLNLAISVLLIGFAAEIIFQLSPGGSLLNWILSCFSKFRKTATLR